MKSKKETLIYGLHPVIEAINSGKDIDKVLIKKGIRGEISSELINKLKDFQIPFQFVPLEKLNRVTRKNHQGVLAFISPIPFRDISEVIQNLFEEGKDPFILMLDRITDVRNFGAIARTAECMGVDAILVPAKESAQINEDALKTSAGALNKISVCRSFDLATTMDYLRFSGLRSIYTHQEAEKYLYEVDLKGPLVIIMGSEEKGVSGQLIKLSDEGVNIPMAGTIESLNVSVAAGMILYEALKQRQP
jgi:23S rRNA (guanosine2251-2'-O)-methyltransferase